MSIEVVARDVVVNDEVHDRIEKKLVKILERTSKETPVRVLLENSRGRYLANITMTFMGKDIVAQSEEKNLLAAIDEAVEKAERQFSKITGKLQSRRATAAAPEEP